MGIESTMIPVLAVALITWGGVFLYLLRLDGISRKLEEMARDLPRAELTPPESDDAAVTSSVISK